VLAGESVSRGGWIESVEEREAGVASVSAPVVLRGGELAAVSISGPIERLSRTPGKKFGAVVVGVARTIEVALKGS
jgi:DNA-binding IclR family transcriptional regulator